MKTARIDEEKEGEKEGERDMMLQVVLSGVVSEDAPSACVA